MGYFGGGEVFKSIIKIKLFLLHYADGVWLGFVSGSFGKGMGRERWVSVLGYVYPTVEYFGFS